LVGLNRFQVKYWIFPHPQCFNGFGSCLGNNVCV
jgi:hypothetical protein